jgi:serine/threonine protein kinase/tetratricopeptide (TPR) repeat protein
VLPIDADEALLMIGKTLGHYQITTLLGRGGMGEVYQAKDQKLGRDVAIKVLPEEFARDADRVERFQREAKLLASLNHTNIAGIHGLEESEGTNFLVLELVEGETLAERLKHGLIAVEESLKLALQIADALEAAHAKGVIHRDLKPANIKITPDGKVKVLDFGLAKQLIPASTTESMEETQSALTQSGMIAGTLAYMSPEQLQVKPIDGRSDLFSFGTILYEMLSGVHPFSRASAMETASAILTETPLPLDQRKRGIPRQLQNIAEKLLAKDPVQRYQSAHEVHADLGQIPAAGQVVSTGWRRFRWIWIVIALIVLVFGVAPLSWWVRDNYLKSPQAALAFQERDWILISDFENLTGDPVFDRSLQTAMTVGIQQSKYVNVLPTSRVQEALKRMRKDSGARLDENLACEIAIREGAKAVLACSISDVGGVYSLTVRLVEPGKRVTVMSRASQATGKNQVLPTLDSLVKIVRENLGESLQSIERQGLFLPRATTASLEALKTFAEGRKLKNNNDRAGIELIKQAVTLDPDFALAHADLGMIYYMEGARQDGEKHFTRALALLDRLTLREQLWIQALIEDWRGNRDQAIEHYKTYLTQYADDSYGWYRLAWLYMAGLGQYERSIEAFKRVLKISPSDIGSYLNLGTCYMGLRQYEKAKENYEKGFELSPPQITGRYINHEYGFTLVRLGDFQKAAETFQKMIAGEDKARGYRSLALLNMYQGKLSDAIANLRQAILINRAGKIATSEYLNRMYLASAYRLKGRNADFTSEIATAARILAQESFDPYYISILARVYARLGKIKEASRLFDGMSSAAKNLTALSGLDRSDRLDQATIDMIKGEIAVARGKLTEAIEALEISRQIDPRDARLLESLAFAYRRFGKPQEAANKYLEVIADYSLGGEAQEHWILAHYELAKIYKELGDTQKAKEYYMKFLNIWKDADPDIPILAKAKTEYSKLQQLTSKQP